MKRASNEVSPRSAKERKAAFDQRMSNRGRTDPTSPERWPCTIYLTAEAKQRLAHMREERQMLGCATETNSALVEMLIHSQALDVRPSDLRIPPSVGETIRDLTLHLREVREELAQVDAMLLAHLADWIRQLQSAELMDRVIRAARSSPTDVAARYEVESEVSELIGNFIDTFSDRAVPEPLKRKSAQWIDKLLRARSLSPPEQSDQSS